MDASTKQQAKRAAVIAGLTAGAVVVPVVAAAAAPDSRTNPHDGMPPPIEAAVKVSGHAAPKAPVEKPKAAEEAVEVPVTTSVEMSSIETQPAPKVRVEQVEETALPKTGANPVVAALGAGFLVGGALLRRGFREET
jgi:LPXTG-motif cell wall-anchored protein